jgi:anti-sigma28 factor (negative regulator of flagellin synthesis)
VIGVDVVFMSATDRLRTRKGPSKAVLSTSPAMIARQSRVEEIRRLVAAGKYRVEPQKLALKILTRALRER